MRELIKKFLYDNFDYAEDELVTQLFDEISEEVESSNAYEYQVGFNDGYAEGEKYGYDDGYDDALASVEIDREEAI